MRVLIAVLIALLFFTGLMGLSVSLDNIVEGYCTECFILCITTILLLSLSSYCIYAAIQYHIKFKRLFKNDKT